MRLLRVLVFGLLCLLSTLPVIAQEPDCPDSPVTEVYTGNFYYPIAAMRSRSISPPAKSCPSPSSPIRPSSEVRRSILNCSPPMEPLSGRKDGRLGAQARSSDCPAAGWRDCRACSPLTAPPHLKVCPPTPFRRPSSGTFSTTPWSWSGARGRAIIRVASISTPPTQFPRCRPRSTAASPDANPGSTSRSDWMEIKRARRPASSKGARSSELYRRPVRRATKPTSGAG